MISRRGVLASVTTAGVGTLLATLPRATAATDLEASVEVVDAQLHRGGPVLDVTGLTLDVTNHEDQPLTPVPSIWGADREAQVSWRPKGGNGDWLTVAPGETRRLEVGPPRPIPTVNLVPDEPAMVRLFDRGTERRTQTVFVPEQVADWEVSDGQ
jgi:hypothetical protein